MKMGNLGKLLLLAAASTAALGCDDDKPADGCSGGTCVEIYNSYFTEEACIDDPSESCKFANVYFVMKDRGDYVTDLDDNDLDMTISDRQVGVEGAANLTTENGLMIDLLLDRSYSITESNSTTAVLEGARSFVESLPDEALINVSVFASEETVPTFLAPGQFSSSGRFVRKAEAAALIASDYAPYPKRNSVSQTKLFDAVGNLASTTPTSGNQLQGVMVVFTDGADTASTYYESPRAVTDVLKNATFKRKVYAIALGDDINEEDLTQISDGRFFSAADPDSLADAFDEVRRDLGAIYLYKVLVATIESGAPAQLKVKYDGRTIERRFNMSYDSSFHPDPPDPDPICDNSCVLSGNGQCDDGRAGALSSICSLGTDCGDCGPVGDDPTPGCINTCAFANDGECDDGRPGAITSACSFGTDCNDCEGDDPPPECTNTCVFANNGVCEDGGPNATASGCSLGTDCNDCEEPIDPECNDTCLYAGNGACDDGRVGSSSSACTFGSDCEDCSGLIPFPTCENTCVYASNGVCEDGRPGSASTACGLGTDCGDCGELPATCDNSCAYALNGVCDDGTYGGPISCSFGTDCNDCLVAPPTCENTCSYAYDGQCDDGTYGGPIYCSDGTDCADCAVPPAECDTCQYANDGECDDGSFGGPIYCSVGTDCSDCGGT